MSSRSDYFKSFRSICIRICTSVCLANTCVRMFIRLHTPNLCCECIHLTSCMHTSMYLLAQAYVRGWLARLRYNELRRQVSAAVVLQAWWRGISDRRKFRKVVRTTILIQSWWRGYKQRKLLVVLTVGVIVLPCCCCCCCCVCVVSLFSAVLYIITDYSIYVPLCISTYNRDTYQ